MASYNRVVLIGNLTQDPELRYIPSGTAVSDVRMAVNDRVKRNDQWVDEATFVDVTLWARTAEVANEYLSKGSQILIEGRLKLDSWETNEGQKRSKLKVVGERMQLLGGRGGASRGGPRGNQPAGQAAIEPSRPAPSDDDSGPPQQGDGDDIPF